MFEYDALVTDSRCLGCGSPIKIAGRLPAERHRCTKCWEPAADSGGWLFRKYVSSQLLRVSEALIPRRHDPTEFLVMCSMGVTTVLEQIVSERSEEKIKPGKNGGVLSPEDWAMIIEYRFRTPAARDLVDSVIPEAWQRFEQSMRSDGVGNTLRQFRREIAKMTLSKLMQSLAKYPDPGPQSGHFGLGTMEGVAGAIANMAVSCERQNEKTRYSQQLARESIDSAARAWGAMDPRIRILREMLDIQIRVLEGMEGLSDTTLGVGLPAPGGPARSMATKPARPGTPTKRLLVKVPSKVSVCCPDCLARLSAPCDRAGKNVTCPRCEETFVFDLNDATFAVSCPGCQKKLSIQVNLSGKTVKCPHCGTAADVR